MARRSILQDDGSEGTAVGARLPWFALHLAVFATAVLALVVVAAVGVPGRPGLALPVTVWGGLVALHAGYAFGWLEPEVRRRRGGDAGRGGGR